MALYYSIHLQPFMVSFILQPWKYFDFSNRYHFINDFLNSFGLSFMAAQSHSNVVDDPLLFMGVFCIYLELRDFYFELIKPI